MLLQHRHQRSTHLEMTNTFISLLFAAATASAIQLGLPAATSYVYRSDNNGPATLLQLGPHGYHQPHAYALPLPLVQPSALETYNIAPAPLPYTAAEPIIVTDAEEDDEESSEEQGDDYHGQTAAGSDYAQEHHAAHGEKGRKGYKSKGHHAKGASGHYGKEHKEGHYDESKGDKASHHDVANVQGNHYGSAKNYKGGDHGHKKHFSKGEDITGYHKVFSKDEFKKDHDFYDVADKSGHFNKHGYEEGHHGAENSGHKKGGKHASGYGKGAVAKSRFLAKGHVDEGDSGHSVEKGHNSNFNHEEDYKKEGDSSNEKEYSHVDDDDYDEDDEDDNTE